MNRIISKARLARTIAGAVALAAVTSLQAAAQVERSPLDPPDDFQMEQLNPPAEDGTEQLDPPAEGGTEQVTPPVQAPVAQRIANPVAEFTGVDKITGRTTTFDVYVDETVQFGALQVTPRVCYSAPNTEEQKTDSFVEVDEITLDRKIRRIFTGWMFAESPGLNAVEHGVYDVWLKACKQESTVPPPEQPKTD